MRTIGLVCLVGLLFSSGCTCGGFPVPTLPEKVVGICKYKNGFSGLAECKEYVGEWTEKEASDDCKSNGSTVVLKTKCGIPKDERFGDCIFIVDKAKEKYARVELPGKDAAKCGSMERGCEFFGGGSFVPTEICGGANTTPPETLPIFQQPERVCKPPKAGEAAGKGPDGNVCTWSAIAGATEEGRDFDEYGDCSMVRTQRPYYPVPPAPTAKDPDPRLNDPAYLAESAWVQAQIRSSACVCCHTTKAPKGPSNWYLESGPNWVQSLYPRGLAMGAGWIDTVGFGAFPPEQNNGFSRATPDNPNHSAFPTTDDARMRRFFEAELAYRKKTKDDFKDEKYGAGPLDTQRFYVPTDCTEAQAIAKDGTITWLGGPARYLHLMEATSSSPGVPPNLDIPKGTLWRIDVDWRSGTPLESGSIRYGVAPQGTKQRVPESGAPPPLVSGQRYYLVIQKDIANPITRCLVTAP